MTAGRSLRRTVRRMRMNSRRLATLEPLSDDFGYSRGTPIDRHYIEAFLSDHSADIRGRVLEVGDDAYTRRFGGDRVVTRDILHVAQGHPGATITGDLSEPGLLPDRSFDCIILTQTLHLIFDMASAIGALNRALVPGGILLVTTPGISPIDRGEWKDRWHWSLTELSLSRLLSGPFDPGQVRTSSYGNLFAATAFLHGASVEEAGKKRLTPIDPSYPVTVAARAVA